MNDELNGFLFEMISRDANAPAGERTRHLYAIADAHFDLRALPAGTRLISSGADILTKARELGVADNDLKIVDA